MSIFEEYGAFNANVDFDQTPRTAARRLILVYTVCKCPLWDARHNLVKECRYKEMFTSALLTLG